MAHDHWMDNEKLARDDVASAKQAALGAENADLRSRLDAATRRIEQARETLREGAFIYYSLEHRAEVFRLRAMDARTILTEPANAEGERDG